MFTSSMNKVAEMIVMCCKEICFIILNILFFDAFQHLACFFFVVS